MEQIYINKEDLSSDIRELLNGVSRGNEYVILDNEKPLAKLIQFTGPCLFLALGYGVHILPRWSAPEWHRINADFLTYNARLA